MKFVSYLRNMTVQPYLPMRHLPPRQLQAPATPHLLATHLPQIDYCCTAANENPKPHLAVRS